MAWSRMSWALASVAVLHAGSAVAQGPNVAEREIQTRRLGDGPALVVGRFILDGGGQPEHSGWVF